MFKSKGSIGYSYRTPRYRYTEWINKFGKLAAAELYDYETDPFETRNHIDDSDYAAVRSRLSEQMRADAGGCNQLLAAKLPGQLSATSLKD